MFLGVPKDFLQNKVNAAVWDSNHIIAVQSEI